MAMLGHLIRPGRGHAPEDDGADRSDDAPQEQGAVVIDSSFDMEALGWFAGARSPVGGPARRRIVDDGSGRSV